MQWLWQKKYKTCSWFSKQEKPETRKDSDPSYMLYRYKIAKTISGLIKPLMFLLSVLKSD